MCEPLALNPWQKSPRLAMNAVGLYVSAARLVLQNDGRDYGPSNTNASLIDEQDVLDLFRLLPHLRQSLSCAVCTRILSDPFAPRDARCQHNVCRLCVRGRKQIRPTCAACKDCQDFKVYEENKQMRCLLLCYKSLCEHLMGSPLFQQISMHRGTPLCISSGIAVPTMSAKEFIMEGASYEDILSAFSIDLPRPKLAPAAVLPPITYSNSTAASLVPISAAALPLSKNAATPTTPQPQQQLSLPLPMVIKQEDHSTSNSCTSISQAKTSQLTTSAAPVQTIKSRKNVVDLSCAVQLTAASMASLSSLPQTVTYVGHPPTGNVVVPLLSSSSAAQTVTTAPLTIASAKLQSLSRQLAAQQQRNLISASTSSQDVKPSLPFKLASTTFTTPATTAPNASSASLGVTTTSATVTSQQVRNPPPIKTVSNGSAMYSVLYAGIGNKITIKRKTDGDDDSAQKKNFSSSTAATSQNSAVYRPQVSKTNAKRRGCRCGNATPTPGKLTCCGQRCPCYVDSKSCIGCKCRGCRNPHRPDGGKVRPIIPELACYEIQMADSEHSALSPGELPIATSNASNKIPASSASSVGQSVNMPLENFVSTTSQPQPQVPPTSRLTIVATSSPTTTTASVIPFRNMQHLSALQQQHHQQTHVSISALSGQPQQQSQQANVLQLEKLQRESLLIQSAEGKYQVVNVFTATNPQHNHANSALQRIHQLPQLQTVGNSGGNVIPNNNNATFLIQSSNSNPPSAAGSVHQMHQIPEISTTLPQIIMQQAHPLVGSTTQQQQAQRVHLQQQFKAQNNVITVHPISSPVKPTATATIAPSTITLSPIIVTSPNSTYTSTDLFSESSSEEFLNDINVNSAVLQPTTTISVSTTPHVRAALGSPFAMSSSSNSGATIVGGISGGQHQQYVELIESTDLRLFPADDVFLASS